MKKIITTAIMAIILTVCMTGCVLNSRTVDYTHAWPLQPAPNNELVIVNASTYTFAVLTDGKVTKEELKPGETCTIQAWCWRSTEEMVVTVVGIEHAVTQSRVYELYRHGKFATAWTITDAGLRGRDALY